MNKPELGQTNKKLLLMIITKQIFKKVENLTGN